MCVKCCASRRQPNIFQRLTEIPNKCNICQTAFTRSDTLIAHQQTIKIEIHHLSVTGQDMMGYDELGWFSSFTRRCCYWTINICHWNDQSSICCARQRRHRGHTSHQFPQTGSDKKENSVNWEHVRFKKNCLVVDPLGAGELTRLPSILPDKASLLY